MNTGLAKSYWLCLVCITGVLTLPVSSTPLSSSNSTDLILNATPLGCITETSTKICFYFFNNASSWDDSWKTCQNSGLSLAAISSKERDGMVQEGMNQFSGLVDHESPGYKAWIAGRASLDHKWKWIDGAELKDDDSVVKFVTKPKDYQNCAAVESPLSTEDKLIKFTGRSCRTTLHFLCQEKQTDATLKTGDACKISTHSGIFAKDRCVVPYGNDPQNYYQGWRKAVETCRAINASLAVFDGLTGDEVLHVVNYQPGVYWIGLTNQDWIWAEKTNSDDQRLSGSPVGYSHWYPNPDVTADKTVRECMSTGVYERSQYGWTDELCSDQLPVICQLSEDLETVNGSSSQAAHIAGASPENELQDWANVIIPCSMVALIAIAAVLSVICHYRQKRKDYNTEK